MRTVFEDTHVFIPGAWNLATWPKGVKAAGGIRLLVRDLKSHEILGQTEEGRKVRQDLRTEKMAVMGPNKQIKQNKTKKPKNKTKKS